MKNAIILLTAAFAALFISSVIQIHKMEQQRLQIIDGVCSWSIDGDTSSEKALCGRLQDTTHTEYMCRDDFNCWVEAR